MILRQLTELLVVIIIALFGLGAIGLVFTLVLPILRILLSPIGKAYNKAATRQSDLLNLPQPSKNKNITTPGWRAPVEKTEDGIQVLEKLKIDTKLTSDEEAYSDFGYLPMQNIYKEEEKK